MSTEISRLYNFQDDRTNGIPITASRIDGELNQDITALNQKVIIKATAPASPIAGMLWLDSTNKFLKQYRNSEWVIMGVVHVSTTAPTTPQTGDLWMDTTNSLLKYYNGSSQITIGFNVLIPPAIGTTTPAAGKFTTLEGTSTFKLGTTNQGDVLYDNGTSLIRLTPGTAGKVLKTGGAAANPSWDFPSGQLGAWDTRVADSTIYQAATDGFVCAFTSAIYSGADASPGKYLELLSDSASTPTTIRAKMGTTSSTTALYAFVCSLVKKSDYYRINNTTGVATSMFFIPIGS